MADLRNTTQELIPVRKTTPPAGDYDIYPVLDVGDNLVHEGYASLARRMAGHGTVTVDGVQGVFYDIFKRELSREFARLGLKVLWWDVSAALRPAEEIERMVEPFLGGDDPIFGFRTTLSLADFYDPAMLASIKPDKAADVNILTGPGTALARWEGPLFYLEVPKNEIQFRMRAGAVTNLGVEKPCAPKPMYKRSYFVDWVVAGRHKKDILRKIDVFVDGQRPFEPTWAEGATVIDALKTMSVNMFRVRPWFEPGAWGGGWIRDNITALPDDVPNYAWSFELIVPENGLLIGSGGVMLEVPFETIMFACGENVLGERDYAKYGDEFPIRMDFLDNFDGGNLSIQCHPQLDYMRENFGEMMTQEETYYILDTKDDAVVYLGFREDIAPGKFEAALIESFVSGTPFDVDRYVQSVPARKHGLYLIPPGTLHSSGRNNLVLEISTTPYIFTFKMYDWLALDLDGKPRPLNIRRGMENLCFERKGDVVTGEHVSKPELIASGEGWQLYHLPTHRNHSYDVHRYNISGGVMVETEEKCHVLSLVGGESVTVECRNGLRQRINYAETFVVPAAAGSYTITSDGSQAMVVKAFMK